MKLKTVSVDVEAFKLLQREKGPRESYGDVVRRVFAAHAESSFDPSEHLDELFERFGGKGVLSAAGRARVMARQKNPPRSRRPARAV
jgi:predicted CopG family antitoxin